MFVRKKQNKSDVFSVQTIDKRSDKYKLLKTIGSSSSLAEVGLLFMQGQHWLRKLSRPTGF
jgi:hypothetical protein